MKIRKLIPLLALAACLVASTAYAQEPEPEPTPTPTPSPTPTVDPNLPVFTRADVWFHQADQRIANLGSTIPGWDNTKPVTEAPNGAGAIYYLHQYPNNAIRVQDTHDPRYSATFAGKHVGDLDNMAIDLYLHAPAYVLPCPMSFAFDFRIDGQTVMFQRQSDAIEVGIPEPSNTADNVWRLRFALTNLYGALEEFELETADDFEHEVYVNFINYYVCNEANVFFDSAQAPSGAIFNLEAAPLKAYTKIDVLNPPQPEEAAGLSTTSIGSAQLLR